MPDSDRHEPLDIPIRVNVDPLLDDTANLGSSMRRFRRVWATTYYGDGSNLTGIAAGGSPVTVEEVDGVPSIASISKIQFDQSDGFVLTNPSGTIARIDLAAIPDAAIAALAASKLTGTVAVNQGGTGVATLAANGILFGNGTAAVGVTTVGTATHVLTSNGVGVAPTFQAAAGGGTVTTTGTPASGNLTKFSGATSIVNGDLAGDVTTSGTLTTVVANLPAGVTTAGRILATAIVAPATPGVGIGSLYVDSTSKNLSIKDDAGIIKHGVQTLAAVGSKWLTSINDAGLPAATQPAFTDISGSVAATQLPNPSSTTLGGVQSKTVVASQWLNTISTTGVPASTQPGFTDITGSVTTAQIPVSITTSNLEFIIDGGGSVLTTGLKGYLEVPWTCTIARATLLADVSGSCVIDVWKVNYATFNPPTRPVSTDKITASAPPTITTAVKSQDSTLTGWTLGLTSGDVLGFNVTSATTITRVTLSLQITR